MATTTATQRELARLYEARCEWAMAARCWQQALDLYPRTSGELAQRDKAMMAERVETCLRAAA